MTDGKEIYNLNKENLLSAKPDLIISQNICEVCSAHTEHVKIAVEMLEKKPEVYTMDPHDVDEDFGKHQGYLKDDWQRKRG